MRKLIVSVLLACTFHLGFSQIDSTYKVAVKKLLQVTGTEEVFKTGIQTLFETYRAQYKLPIASWNMIEKEFLLTSLDELTEMFAPAYYKFFTLDDINAMITFYESPVGKKYAENSPDLMQETMKIGKIWGAEIGEKLQERILENER